MSQGENDYEEVLQRLFNDQTEIDPTDMSQGENDYQEVDQTEIDPTEMSQGENKYQEVDQTEIDATETSQGDNDNQEVQHLGARLIDGTLKTEFFFSSPCIYRVPRELRKLNESAYTPRLIAIGPLHQNDKHLQTPMQHVKRSYANNLLCRLTEGMEDLELPEKKKLTVLRDCMAAIKESLEDAKKCYPEEVELDVEMMLVDGCFILEFLYISFWGSLARNSKGANPIFANGSTYMAIEHDLLLLENQIPFVVLEKLFSLTVERIPSLPQDQIPHFTLARISNLLHKKLSLTDYVFLFMVDRLMRPEEGKSTNSGSKETSRWPRDCILRVLGKKMNNSKPEEKVPSEEEAVVSSEKEDSTNTGGSAKTSCRPRDCILWVSGNKISSSKPEEKVASEQEGSSKDAKCYRHILHKLHDDYLPHDKKGKGKCHTEELPSASELVYAGVKFVRSTGTGAHRFNVRFIEHTGLFWWCHRARFEIPYIEIDDATESVLRNLIAFEQCFPGTSQHFTSYALLMDMLVNYDKDVEVLEKAGVLRNCLGAAKDVTDLFNKLGKEVSYGDFFFAETCNKAIKYRKHCWPKNMAHVRRKYFASPWTFIAFCLGFIVFGITIAKFIHGFLTSCKPL